jgi:RimJ/RimL family protein N-acetyltransferase
MRATERLLLRRWRPADLAPFAALNADPVVMEHFPGTLSRARSDAMVERLDAHLAEHGWGIWAVEVPGVTPFAGFVGLASANGVLGRPAIEVGWRLDRACWGNGYATEGAREALRVGFGELALAEIVSFTVAANVRSRAVMERLGMTRDPADDFDHPNVDAGAYPHLVRHVLYRISSPPDPR